jgi:hypothetical protein
MMIADSSSLSLSLCSGEATTMSLRGMFWGMNKLQQHQHILGLLNASYIFLATKTKPSKCAARPSLSPLRQPWNYPPCQETAISLCRWGIAYAVYKTLTLFYSFRLLIIFHYWCLLSFPCWCGSRAFPNPSRLASSNLSFSDRIPAESPGESGFDCSRRCRNSFCRIRM